MAKFKNQLNILNTLIYIRFVTFEYLSKENFKVVNSKSMHNLENCKNVGNFKITLLYSNITLVGEHKIRWSSNLKKVKKA